MATVTCPECGRELPVNDPNRKFMFCRHCGARINVADCINKPQQSDTNADNAQHDLEMERLRHEHELEMEHLRHEHEMEYERLKHKYAKEAERAREAERAEEAEPADPAEEAEYYEPPKKHRKKKKPEPEEGLGLWWGIRRFCAKHPIWTIIIIYAIFMAVFGDSSTSSSSSSSRSRASSPASSITATSSNLPDAKSYTEVYSSGTGDDATYYLFDFTDKKVCFAKSSNKHAYVTDFYKADFESGFDTVFYFSDGYISRYFQYKEVNGVTVLSVIEKASNDGVENEFHYLQIDQPDAASILNTMSSVMDCSSN